MPAGYWRPLAPLPPTPNVRGSPLLLHWCEMSPPHVTPQAALIIRAHTQPPIVMADMCIVVAHTPVGVLESARVPAPRWHNPPRLPILLLRPNSAIRW